MILLDTLIPAFDRYLEGSTAYWARLDGDRPRDNGYIVVDLMHNHATVLVGSLLVGRYVAHCNNARLAAVVCERFLGWPSPVAQVRRLGAAFGVERFYQIEPGASPQQTNLPSSWLRGWVGSERDRLLRKLRGLSGAALRGAILDIAITGIDVGDLIYDTYLRRTARASIDTLDAELIDEIAGAFSRLHQYREVMGRRENIGCVTSDNCYVDLGGLLRTSVALGKLGTVKVLALPSCVRRYENLDQCRDFPWPRGEDAAFVRQCLGSELERSSAEFFPPRRQRADEISYFQIAYGADVRRVGAAELRAQLGLSADIPAIGIMVPMFEDAPHSIPDLLYQDSGRWLEETLAICATLRHVVWLVRNHPYSVTVGLTSEFERIVAPYVARYPHIRLCPSDFSTESLFSLLHASVSVASTASLEFASVGIPGVICGRPYFADPGFLVRPRSTAEYAAVLQSIDQLKPLTPSQISAAKQIAYIYFRCVFQRSTLLPQTIDLAGKDLSLDDIARYWDEATELLRTYRFQDDPMWRNFKRMVELGHSLQLRFDELEAHSAPASQ